jgi:hypothetical protein
LQENVVHFYSVIVTALASGGTVGVEFYSETLKKPLRDTIFFWLNLDSVDNTNSSANENTWKLLQNFNVLVKIRFAILLEKFIQLEGLLHYYD